MCHVTRSLADGTGVQAAYDHRGRQISSTAGHWHCGVLGPHRTVDDCTGELTEALRVSFVQTADVPLHACSRRAALRPAATYGVYAVAVTPRARKVSLQVRLLAEVEALAGCTAAARTRLRYALRHVPPSLDPELTWRRTLLFVHGFNICVADAAGQFAQLLSLGEFAPALTPVVFGWPCSKGASYFNGKRAIYDTDDAVGRLVEFVAELRSAGCEELHVMAHSLGAALFCRAAAVPEFGRDLHVRTVTLLHPDVPLKDFVGRWAHVVRACCPVVLVLADRRDGALVYSEFFNRARAAGKRPRELEHVRADVDVLDVGNLDAHRHAMGHNFFTLHPALLRVLRTVVHEGARLRVGMGLVHMGGHRWQCRAPSRRSKNP